MKKQLLAFNRFKQRLLRFIILLSVLVTIYNVLDSPNRHKEYIDNKETLELHKKDTKLFDSRAKEITRKYTLEKVFKTIEAKEISS